METTYYDYNDVVDSSNRYQRFWKEIQAVTNEEKIQKWKDNAGLIEQSSVLNNVVVFMFDYSAFEYFYLSENVKRIVGFTREEFYKDGVNLSVNLIHPDYMAARLAMLHFYVKIVEDYPLEKRKDILISTDFLFKNPQEQYMRTVQQTKFLELDDKGRPLVSLNYLHSFGSIKKEGSSDLIVKVPDEPALLYHYDFDEKKIVSAGQLSAREENILSCLSKGQKTKEIAENLNISPFTVDTHRKNLLLKTHCKDTSSLVLYAKTTGLM